MREFTVATRRKEEMVNITTFVWQAIQESGKVRGICTVYVPHTTAGVTINESADPDVVLDILRGLRHAVPENLPFEHGEGNAPAHVKASLVGPSVSVLFEDGKLLLGTWQGIFLCEFDGPRTRRVWVQVVGE